MKLEIEEDTQHVLMECPRHTEERRKMKEQIATLAKTMEVSPPPPNLNLMMNPAHNRVQKRIIQHISHITGRFIAAIHKNKKF